MRIPGILWISTVVLAAGCAGPAAIILEEPVGPRDLSGSKSGNGSLIVYTEMEPLNGDRDFPVRSGYALRPADGTKETRVSNRGRLSTDPVPVSLPAGRYRVLARGPLYESISVVVVIQPRDQTVVDLTGETFDKRANQGGDWVRLPSGVIVGPKAKVE